MPIRETELVGLFFSLRTQIMTPGTGPWGWVLQGMMHVGPGTLLQVTVIDDDTTSTFYKEVWHIHAVRNELGREEEVGTRRRSWQQDDDGATHSKDMESWFGEALGSSPGRGERNKTWKA